MIRPESIETRYLAALRAVADEGTFGRAARVLGFSQAAVSQQIAGLERALGTAVFDRPGGPRPVVLTPSGRVVLRHARAVLDRLERAGTEVEAVLSGAGGRLAVGTFQSVSVRLLPTLVAETLAHAPDLAIEVVPGEVSSQLAGWLLEGRVDVTFLDQPVDDPHIAVDLVLRDPYVVVTRLDDPALRGLGRGAGYPVRALGEQPLVAPEPHHAHTVIESWLADHGVTPRYSFRTNDNGSLQAMVSAGLGPALMPLLAVDEADPAVRVLRTEPPLPPRDVLVARRTDTTALPAADVFARRAVIAGGARELRLASETRPRSRRRTADADG